MAGKTDRGAVLQFEIDRRRWLGTNPHDMAGKYSSETMPERLEYIARTAISDTLRHGGTFVMVVADDKITMVQRPDAEQI